MTPDEANTELTTVARAVMNVLAPGEDVDLHQDGGQTTLSGSSCCPVGPIWMSVPISGQTPQS